MTQHHTVTAASPSPSSVLPLPNDKHRRRFPPKTSSLPTIKWGKRLSFTSLSEFKNMMTRSPGRSGPSAEDTSLVLVAASSAVVSFSRNEGGGGGVAVDGGETDEDEDGADGWMLELVADESTGGDGVGAPPPRDDAP
mmetsp:Transcript_17958/g.36260  ORF Transcript_17958/g.36260 Transcript_17958/m.36260 type:complete len:138 (+) Transcript_17958:2185-2598(+)